MTSLLYYDVTNPSTMTSLLYYDVTNPSTMTSLLYYDVIKIVQGIGSRTYIACSAPLASTVEAFWRLIWEKNISLVIMLCGKMLGYEGISIGIRGY